MRQRDNPATIDGFHRPRAFDRRTDSPLETPFRKASSNAILLFDGIFSQRSQLTDLWDLRIFLDANFEETLRALVNPQSPSRSVRRRTRAAFLDALCGLATVVRR